MRIPRFLHDCVWHVKICKRNNIERDLRDLLVGGLGSITLVYRQARALVLTLFTSIRLPVAQQASKPCQTR